MKKTTFLTFWLILFAFFKLNANSKEYNLFSNLKNTFGIFDSPLNDKNLLKGSWQIEAETQELRIKSVLDSGLLEVEFFNGNRVIIEKAGWSNSSNVLRVFVLFGQEDKSGYSLTLNYLLEKDLLVGVYVDGATNKSFTVVFKRSK